MMNPLKSVASLVVAASVVAMAQAAGDGWLTSYPQALKLSAQTGKPVLADFTGSDWCTYCHMLDNEVFSKSAFKQWATKNVILLKLDYPRMTALPVNLKKQNTDLLKKYPVKGFPTIFFLNSTGKAVGMYGYDQGGPAHWTAMADRLVKPNTVNLHPTSLHADASGFPAKVDKAMLADNDFRGKKAPKLIVEKWVSGKAPDTTGKVVLIDFWATWCPGCREVIPELGAWQKKYGKDLVVIGITDENQQKVMSFMQQTPMPYNVAIDTHKSMNKSIGIQSIPQVMILTPDHIVRWQGFPGDRSDLLTEDILAQIIQASKKHVVASRI